MFMKQDRQQHPFFAKHDGFGNHDFFGKGQMDKEAFFKRFEQQGGFGRGDFSGEGRFDKKRFFKRGDIKIVLLKLISEQPRHGYELIKVLEEKFQGFYSPSPGSIYPTLQMLEDQDLIEVAKEGRKKIFHITDEGQTYLNENQSDDSFISRMNMFDDVDFNEIMTLRNEFSSLFKSFFEAGRKVINDPEKVQQLKNLVHQTSKELDTITNDSEQNTEE